MGGGGHGDPELSVAFFCRTGFSIPNPVIPDSFKIHVIRGEETPGPHIAANMDQWALPLHCHALQAGLAVVVGEQERRLLLENQRLELEVRFLREQMARLGHPGGPRLEPPGVSGSVDEGPSTSGNPQVSEIEIKPLNFLVDQFVCLGEFWPDLRRVVRTCSAYLACRYNCKVHTK